MSKEHESGRHRSSSTSSSSTPSEESVKKAPNVVNDVRILPEVIIFDDPFEGKCFQSEIVMQNIGNKSKFIRILPPTSGNIKMVPAIKGIFLSPGMRIIRKITYNVVMATLVKSFVIPIYINNTCIPFHCEVRMAKIIFEIVPPNVNFGKIDVGPTTSKQTFKIINKCEKPGRYSIDMGSNQLKMQIEPMRGLVMDNSSVTLTIELKVAAEGVYESEFWVICDSPIRVNVFVSASKTVIECINPEAMMNFTLVKFPAVYYGTKYIKSLLIHNTGQMASMFCCTGDTAQITLGLLAIKKLEKDYGNFDVSPCGGRLGPNEKRPFLFTFEPKFDRHKQINRFVIIMVTIHKILCRDIGTVKYNEPIFRVTEDVERDHTGSFSSISTDGFILSSDFVDDDFLREDDAQIQSKVTADKINVIMFGQTQRASVSVVPDELSIADPVLSQTITRTLILTNSSQELPIYFRYVKLAFVCVEPNFGLLRPAQSLEIAVRITPESCTNVDEWMRFELLYHDLPRLDGSLKVIGEAKLRMRFQAVFPEGRNARDFVTANTFAFDKPNCKPNQVTLELLKQESAMLALPDVRPGSLKPWKDPRRCRTIYSAIPRPIEARDELYMLTKSQERMREFNRSYYTKHSRLKERADDEVQLGDSNADIFERFRDRCAKPRCKKRPVKVKGDFLPLTSIELFNIVIDPLDAYFEGMMSRSSFPASISVTNKNDFAIRVYFRPQKMASFYFPSGERMEIGARATEKMTYLFYTDTSGIWTTMLDLVVNENHVFTASITVRVSSPVMDIDPPNVVFEAEDLPYKCLTIRNVLNAPIDFCWDFYGDFFLEPLDGTVSPGRSLTCVLYYEEAKCTANSYELQVKMDNRRLKTVRVLLNKVDVKVLFTETVNFGNLGRDIEHTVMHKLENKSADEVSYKFNTFNLEEGIVVTPESGTIPRRGFLVISFTMRARTLGPFECSAQLIYARSYFKTVNVVGNVEFPKIFVSPNQIRFRKMAASSFDIKCITVANQSDVPAAVSFDPAQFPELHYNEYYDSAFLTETDVFHIPPNGKKVFSLHLYPFYSTSTSLQLPIMVNGLDISMEKSAQQPPAKVYVATLEHRITLDKWNYNFSHFPHYDHRSHDEERVAIQVKQYTKLCIRLDELKPPFGFKHVSGGTAVRYDYSIVFELHPHDELLLDLTFQPDSPGSYVMKLPFYIKDDLSEDMHNYIYVRGEYPQPALEFAPGVVHFGFVPCRTAVSRPTSLTMNYHQPDCVLEFYCEDPNVSVEFQASEMQIQSTFGATFTYSSLFPAAAHAEVKWFCSCGSNASVWCFGGADNCILTTYEYIMYYEVLFQITPDVLFGNGPQDMTSRVSIDGLKDNCVQRPPFVSSYPYFPGEDNELAGYMDRLLSSIELWLYQQIFHTEIFYKIPDTISFCQIERRTVARKNDPSFKLLYPLLDIMKHYCGTELNSILQYNYNEGDDLTVFIYETNDSILTIMRQVGAFLPHVNAEYLMDYNSYLALFKAKRVDGELMSRERFRLLGKRCWLDVILQMFRLFFYQKISAESSKSNCNLRRNLVCSIQSGLDTSNQLRLNDDVYSSECELYLAWLSKCLNDTKVTHCLPEFEPGGKFVQNFTCDLCDGLAFCAATIKYCPFLAKHFRGLYSSADTKEECLHNASLVIRAWEMLDISFKLTPHDLIGGDPVVMMMLVSFLYEFLTHLFPMDTVTLKADLGGKKTEQIVVTNHNADAIKFTVKIFNDEDNVFSAPKAIGLESGETKRLNITYHAKFIRKVVATITLIGDSYSTKYFTNGKSYQLVGEPLLGSPTFTKTLKVRAYQLKSFSIDIQSPIKEATTYEMFISYEQPESFADAKLRPYSALFHKRNLAMVYIENCFYTTTADGVFTIAGTACPIALGRREWWVFFKSAAGDFYMVVTCLTHDSKEVFELVVQPDHDPFTAECACRHHIPDIGNTMCPKNVRVQIPVNNPSLWRCAAQAYVRAADEKETLFWEKYIEEDFGPILLKKILSSKRQFVAPTMEYAYRDAFTFFLSGGKRKEFSHAEKIHLDTQQKSAETTLHLNGTSKTVSLTLTGDDGLEKRKYKIRLLV